MYSVLPVLALIAFAAAVPAPLGNDAAWQSNVVETGPWNEQSYAPNSNVERNPKNIMERLTESLPSPTNALARLGSWWDWDRDTVKAGIFENENIMIHVGQNLFNFVFTTLAWFTVSQIYSLTAQAAPADSPRSGRSLTITEAADEVLDAIRKFENKYWTSDTKQKAIFNQTDKELDAFTIRQLKQGYQRQLRQKRSDGNVNYYRSLLDLLQNDLYIPEQILSKKNVLGVTKYARKIIDIYELISSTFDTINIVLDVLKALITWAI